MSLDSIVLDVYRVALSVVWVCSCNKQHVKKKKRSDTKFIKNGAAISSDSHSTKQGYESNYRMRFRLKWPELIHKILNVFSFFHVTVYLLVCLLNGEITCEIL